jgi:hypothetical protein
MFDLTRVPMEKYSYSNVADVITDTCVAWPEGIKLVVYPIDDLELGASSVCVCV